ncbi:hypothetical protein GcC1_109008 [Golovinomyces cichoracearum]|uniref:Uncharacterized protein n=1 Tax=Golovinomyces cichoracearum TaxID=62708 RepID=A0A420H1T3_9PEZI|nr:hypothetical protein GcM3_222011 [Golovinomyces cichoracearum]RKF66833.1 hypothetical protein GcC1_109008 [Golovinomyces cichoracearum]
MSATVTLPSTTLVSTEYDERQSTDDRNSYARIMVQHTQRQIDATRNLTNRECKLSQTNRDSRPIEKKING